eukprot:scaffold52574_cov78-Phaeocystis_antarctica.AAC.3
MACGSGSTRTRRGSAPPRVGAAAWRATLPALPTGVSASRTTTPATNRPARGLTPGPGSGVLFSATAAGRALLPVRPRQRLAAAFAHDLEALEATRAYNQRLLLRRTSIAFAAAIAIALLPTLLLLGRAGWRRLRRGADAEPSV